MAALAGLTPTPYDSGGKLREQGISKAGKRRIRTLAIEIAWAWLRYQPRSKLSQWFSERFAGGGTRMRRIGIVAWPDGCSSICGVFWSMGWSRKGPC